MKNSRNYVVLSIFFLLLLAMLPSFSNAASTVYKTNITEGYITIKEREMVEFPWKDKIERMMVREISKDNQSVALTFFIEGADAPIYTFLGFKKYLTMDFNRDKEPDLGVQLQKIQNKEITFFLKPLIANTEKVVKEEDKNIQFSTKGIAIAVATFFIVIISWFLLIKRKDKKKRRQEHK